MVVLKQGFAFPMFATCVWLLWVLAQQVDAGGVALALGVLVAAGFALWALGIAPRGAGRCSAASSAPPPADGGWCSTTSGAGRWN